MRIQHNIMAMNAYRNFGNNTSALSKNLEKLSSGYKINRAGDDAAGLAISEKMRAQITGLKAAQKNVKDGISLVKTAEGAMQEIHDMLNRMDYLATQSANGTYDNEVDRDNLQKEVESLKSEIDRISKSANFNGQKLLDGSLSEPKVDITSATFNKQSVTPTVTDATGAESTFTPDKATAGQEYTMTVEYLDANGKSHTVDVKYTGDTTGAKENGAAMQKALAANSELSSVFDIAVDGNSGKITMTSKVTGEKGAKLVSVASGDKALGTGVAVKAGTKETVSVDAKAAIAAGDSLTINGKTYEFVADANAKVTKEGAIAVLVGGTNTATTANLNKVLESEGITVTENTNVLTFSSIKDGSAMKLQIGDTSADYEQLEVSIGNMDSASLGIGDLDIGTPEGAHAAIDKIKAAINTVSSTRGDLGAIQNRLEHTQNNLSVMTENIQDAESTIRDTDVAEEMMAYTKNNILIQSAQAMLAQANQVPQGVLQLLQ